LSEPRHSCEKNVIPVKTGTGIYTLIIALCELRWEEVSDNVYLLSLPPISLHVGWVEPKRNPSLLMRFVPQVRSEVGRNNQRALLQ